MLKNWLEITTSFNVEYNSESILSTSEIPCRSHESRLAAKVPCHLEVTRIQDHRIPSNPIELVDANTPVIRLKNMISYWMGSRVHSLAIKKTNDLTCGILMAHRPPTDFMDHCGLPSCGLTLPILLPACSSASPPIVYLHVIVHVDDYKPYDRSRMQYTMVAISLGEFDAGQRADRSNSFLIPYTIFRRRSPRNKPLWKWIRSRNS